MKVVLDVTGPELVLLYIAYGNEDARRILHEFADVEREFNKPRKQRKPLPAAPESTKEKKS